MSYMSDLDLRIRRELPENQTSVGGLDRDEGNGDWWCPTCRQWVSALTVSHPSDPNLPNIHEVCEGAARWIGRADAHPDRPQDDEFERRVARECLKRRRQAEQGLACPKCWHRYLASTNRITSVTCEACGFLSPHVRKGGVRLCGRTLYVGDYVKVRYTTGTEFTDGILAGTITCLWSNQAQVNYMWCFHDHDELLEHTEELV